MSMGLLALLDDVAAFAKVAAASLDDVAGQATKAGTKAAAVVIDDAAVTPTYVVGFSAKRELPIIFRIAMASLRNKVIILLPLAVALNYFLPSLLTPLLMIGGAYLCYEGAEKIYEYFFPHKAHEHEDIVEEKPKTPQQLEDKTVKDAVRTDFILSAEIMTIALSTVADASVFSQIVVLILIGIFLTVGVYGAVALIVKMDDIGLALARNEIKTRAFQGFFQTIGRGLVKAMPIVLIMLTFVGTAAMTWVGGSIIAHGLDSMGVSAPEHLIHHAAETVIHMSPETLAPVTGWTTASVLQAIFGILMGALVIPLVQFVLAPLKSKLFA